MSNRKWAVRHPGIGVLHYDSQEEAVVAAGTAAEVLGQLPTCLHDSAVPVFNGLRVPVRLVCSCGEEWRVVPIDALVTLNPVVVSDEH